MKKNIKKFASLMLALVMAIGLAAPAFAAQGPNITQLSNTQYTTTINLAEKPEETAFVPVSLYATTTTNWEDNIPFDAQAGVTWSWVGGHKGNDVSTTADGALTFASSYVSVTGYDGPTAGFTPSNTTGFYAKATVSLNASEHLKAGAYSLAATIGTGETASTCNFTIVIENKSASAAVSTNVMLYDGRTNKVILPLTPVTVYAPTAVNPLYPSSLTGKSAALQNNATAMGVFDGLENGKKIEGFEMNDAGSYLEGLATAEGDYVADGNIGWQYGVYKEVTLANGKVDYKLDPVSSGVSASVYPLQANERILWFYGPYTSLPELWNNIK